MATNYYNEFIQKLKEIFMMDHAELDFGIYRIMNQKRDEIMKFLDRDLLPQVKEVLTASEAVDTGNITNRLREIEAQLGTKDVASLASSPMPMVADLVKEYQTLDASLTKGNRTENLQSDVFSHLSTFFSRYYDGGDFISQRRYKDNTYAIPYQGEEVKLYWANADQYYIKTSEYFRDYSFILPTSRKKVHFVLKDADTEQNNNKAADKMERRFAIYVPQDEDEKILSVNEEGNLEIYFTYSLMTKKTKQADLCQQAYQVIREQISENFSELLSVKCPTKAEPNRTLLEKHLSDYTAKNSFDYFIHKDLGGFLSRELDFYLKNEVLHIDDLNMQHIESQLLIVKAIKQVGLKIIQMLAQLENFQKQLWLKKKFVVQCDYCITLDRIPEKYYAEIIANDAQREEWVQLFAINEIKGNLTTEGYSEPLTIEFLHQNPFLVLDTAFFTAKFKHRLLAEFDNVDESCDGLLINSENFQALNLLQEKYRNRISTVITDPPYNTGDDGFLYKDNYEHSSWLSMINDRISLMNGLMSDLSWCSININDKELFNLEKLVELYSWSSITSISVKMSHLSGMKMSHIEKKIPKIKESILLLSKGEDYKLHPIYEKCKWNEALERYDSWIDYNGHMSYTEKWKHIPLRQAAINNNIDVNDEDAYDNFKIKNASRIYRRAVNTLFSTYPHDDIFHSVRTKTGLDKIVLDGEEVLLASSYLKEIDGIPSVVKPKGDIWDDIAINNAHNEGGVQLKNGKKPVKLFERLVKMLSDEKSIILDLFAGSATLAHAVINLNKWRDGKKYILMQDGWSFFEEKTKRRVQNVIYSSDWKLNRPTSRQGSSHCFKYMRLEQYEDTLNNLALQETSTLAFKEGGTFHESYMLNYMLDTETRDSLLNMKWFINPFTMTLKTTKDNELVDTQVDMVETFNYLIGLNVESMAWFKEDNICVVQGRTHRENLKTLVIWRNCEVIDNPALNVFFEKMDFRTKDSEFDVIYVNGDNTLPNIKRDDEHWKVVLIEEEFTKRMFEEI